MRTPTFSHRGMTLAELMIVIAIIGLLAVMVLPSIDANRGQKAGRDAAELLVSHLSQAASKGLGSHQGAAVWLEADSSGAGNGLAVTQLGFARPRTDVVGTTTVTRVASGTATVPIGTFSGVLPLLPAPIRFSGIPAIFNLLASGTEIVSANPSMNRTDDNAIVPNSPGTPLPYTLHIRPNRVPSVRARAMPSSMCIDFSASSIGVPGLSLSTTSLAVPNSRLAITFDSMGRPEYAWYLTPPQPWRAVLLDASTPVVLLVGYAARAGAAPVSVPSEDDPGANWQSPDARWVIVDSRSSLVRVEECDARAATAAWVNAMKGSSADQAAAGQAGLAAAMRFVRETLKPGG